MRIVKHLVAGAGGFIGGHLVKELGEAGDSVRAVDIKPLHDWWQVHGLHQGEPDVECWREDLRKPEACWRMMSDVDRVWNLACDMGGIGFIEGNRAACMRSVLINTNLIEAARAGGVDRYLYSSSACVYPAYRQDSTDAMPLAEDDAYPAEPEDGYGWEKLFSERLCRHYLEDHELDVRVARIHNAYGPMGTWEGGREKAPAALCRKVAQAVRDKRSDLIIWGNGEQTRSFMHVADCVTGLRKIMDGGSTDPVNLGSSELVTINQLADVIEGIAGTSLRREYRLDKPQGVAGRNSDNTRMRHRYMWTPSITLEEGLPQTYEWIAQQVVERTPERVGDTETMQTI